MLAFERTLIQHLVSYRIVSSALLAGFNRAASRQEIQGKEGRGWRRGVVVSGVRRMNEVNAFRARLVLGWVTVFGRVYHLGM